jgi:hypothetical protein
MVLFNFEEDSQPKRKSIPKAVKVTVWNKYIGADKAEGKCYVCKRTIHITDFDLGHNKAVSRGGRNNISNLRPICRTCNTSMQTTSIETFKTRHFDKPKADLKPSLQALSISQLRGLAKKHGIKIRGEVIETLFESHTKSPTKSQYVNRLAKVATSKEISSVPKEVSKPKKKRATRKANNYWW